MCPDGGEIPDLRAAIELALDPPARGGGRARLALRRLALKLSRPRALHQQTIDRCLVNEIERSQHELSELRVWLHNNNGLLEELRGHQRELSERLAPMEGFVAAARAVPEAGALELELFDAGTAGRVIGYRSAPQSVSPQDDYVAFEDVFRLAEKVVKERQRSYVGLLEGRRPVLDVGCGRGEFLELLREAGVPARGVDLDAGMVARARAKGLDVEQGDAVAYLEGSEDDSLGAVFAAQVVEHLPYERLLAFLRLVARKLDPQGILIAETVNPHSPSAFKNFWFDLTHQHPVFPEVLLTLCRSIGFASAYVFHPGWTGDIERDRERAGDYALIAERARGA
jgi:SAM-dependent methyltransferase